MEIESRIEKLEAERGENADEERDEYGLRWNEAYRVVAETMSTGHFLSVNAELVSFYSTPEPRGVTEYKLSLLAWLVNYLCGVYAQGLYSPLMLPEELAVLWLNYEREHIPAEPIYIRHGLYRSYYDCAECGALHPPKPPACCVICGGAVGFNFYKKHEHQQQTYAA